MDLGRGSAFTLIEASQVQPAFDETQRWIANNGFAVVIATLLLSMLWLTIRGLLGNMGNRIDHAVAYFTSKLDNIVDRNERSMDRLDDRLATLSDAQSDAVNRLSAVLREQSNAMREQTAMLSQLAESNRIMLSFMTHNMTELQKHREIVEEEARTGVIKPVDGGQA